MRGSSWLKVLVVILSAVIVVVSGLYIDLFYQLKEQRAPPAADTGGPYFGRPGRGVVFDGTWFYDPDGTIESHVWDFGDGTTGEGAIVSHAYEDEGVYTVTLTVTDSDDLTDSDTSKAMVNYTPYMIRGAAIVALIVLIIIWWKRG